MKILCKYNTIFQKLIFNFILIKNCYINDLIIDF